MPSALLCATSTESSLKRCLRTFGKARVTLSRLCERFSCRGTTGLLWEIALSFHDRKAESLFIAIHLQRSELQKR